MVEALRRADAFAPAVTPIVLHGESGTGKTFFAEYIHHLSGRLGGFHAFSVGTAAPQLAVDELFGHVPGAYTDAHKVRPGRFATAGSGTLLLDDIQNLDLGVQKQLLQVLDRRTYSPVGSDRLCTVGCRVMLAMTADPDELMHQGLLLKDLRYRFGECGIRIAPLAERRAEIPLLAQRFLARCPAASHVAGPQRIAADAMERLEEGEYSGNVRQLEGAILAAYLMAARDKAGEIRVDHLPVAVYPPLRYIRRGDPEGNRRAVERALERTGGSVARAAALLGVRRNTVKAVLRSRRTAAGQVGDRYVGNE